MQEEHYFTCPFCGETISMLVDLSVPAQRYVEDCEVCCQPIELDVQVDDAVLVRFDAIRNDA